MKNKYLVSLTLILVFNTVLFSQNFSLKDFYKKNERLDIVTNETYRNLNDTARVGQMIVKSYGINGDDTETVNKLIQEDKVGGIIYLKGSHQQHLNNSEKIKALNSGIPILFSMDAEPSLMRGRITDFPRINKTKDILTKRRNDSIANLISDELITLGINLNYAPVCDLSSSNKAIKSRSYGSGADSVSVRANEFINASSDKNVLTCAKHFPGHGLVKGDSHHERVFIDGAFKELDVYKQLIANPNLISVMVGHIDVMNNPYSTNKLPSSCSPIIIKKLLKDSLKFKGLVISDALGMHALKGLDNASLQASKAGCDILCMTPNTDKLVSDILNEIKKDSMYAAQIEVSVKKIIRLKICLGLIAYQQHDKKAIIYSHGKIIEEQGVNAVSPKFGAYKFNDIVDSLKSKGAEVIALVRPKFAAADNYALRIHWQVDSLISIGYKPSNITLLGASKGAWITLLASTKLSTNQVNVVVLGICGPDVTRAFSAKKFELKGRVLSIYEKKDDYGESCADINYGDQIKEFREIQLKTGLKHGFLYTPNPAWTRPFFDWIKN
tara:strand:+ start:516 stop:2177 length:1662 start_codon:yes stop_codon:yes gene_type:complete